MPTENSLADLYVAARFVRGALMRSDYHFPDDLTSAITLSSSGQEIRDELINRFAEISDSDLTAAILAASELTTIFSLMNTIHLWMKYSRF
jgi:hypothetical protein